MNTLQRPLFDAPMPMVEGSGITSMAMDEAAGQQLGADLTTAIAQGVSETESAIDAADDNIGIMNALRGKQASEEEYRTELAGYVGRKDANATPDSVLALVQPTIAMMELGDAPSGGIAEMMPPQTFGIEEDVFGKLPVQKLQAGGIAGRFKQIQDLQAGFLPTEDEIRSAFAVQQPTTMQNLLAVGAPFVQGLLAPSQQGGGINAALSLASQAASKQLAQQRALEQQAKQKTQQALIQQRATSGQNALTAALAQDKAAMDRAASVQAAALKAAGEKAPEKIRILEYLQKLPEDSPLREPLQAIVDKMAINPLETIAAQLQSNQSQIQLRADLDRLAQEDKEVRKVIQKEILSPVFKGLEETNQVIGLLSQAENFADIAKTGVGGAFKNKFRNASLVIKEFAPELSPLFDATVKRLTSADIYDEDADSLLSQRAAVKGLQSINAQLALAFTKYFPGNLNQTEVEIAQRAAAGDLNFSAEEYAILKGVFEKTRASQLALATEFRDVQAAFRLENLERSKRKEGLLPQIELQQRLQDAKLKVQERLAVAENERGRTDLDALGSGGYKLDFTPTTRETLNQFNSLFGRLDPEKAVPYFTSITGDPQNQSTEALARKIAVKFREEGVNNMPLLADYFEQKRFKLPYVLLKDSGFDFAAIANALRANPTIGMPRKGVE